MSRLNALAPTLSLLLGVQIATANSAVRAHGVVTPLPTTHAFATASALKSLLLHRKVAALPAIGTGSGTVRLNNSIIKSLISRGYYAGQNQAIASQLGGAVKSGNLYGSIYFNSSGTTYYNLSQYYSFAIGGPPVSFGGAIPGTVNTSNSLLFAPSLVLKQHNLGSVLPYSGGVSGAEKARTALYKSVTTAATSAGSKSITSLGPITGGQLYGTFGEYYGNGNYDPYVVAAIAFGKDPYSSPAIPSVSLSQLKDYLSFANGATRTVTGGQLTFAITGAYSPSSPLIYSYGTFGLAFGNSVYNNSVLYKTYQISLLKNVINLAALKLK